MQRLSAALVLSIVVMCCACSGRTMTDQTPSASGAAPAPSPAAGSFADDLAFLRAHTTVTVLSSPDGRAQVVVAPDYQGRVMTSTAAGSAGASFGYVHRPGISAGTRQPHMTVLGGEDRLWLGPEGGQYGLYFPPGSAFDTEHWQVPEPIDWGAWPVTAETSRAVTFRRTMTVTNYTGTRFDAQIDRTVTLLDRDDAAKALGLPLPATLDVVAYESDNRLTNTGAKPWTKAGGLLSIWILGMYQPAPRTTIVIPVSPGSTADRGPIVNDAYFGAIPADRLKAAGGVVFFRGDGRLRGKIGIPRPRAREFAGSYDPDRRILTIVQISLPDDARDYVNSMWAHQDRPYGGDVINSYNDGPLGPGQGPLGPFYEIESSSPAAALAPHQTLRHVHRTMHLQGSAPDLDAIARACFGVDLAAIVSALPAGGQ